MTAGKLRKFVLPGLIVLLSCRASGDGNVTLTWDPSPSPDASNYNIYYGFTSGVYDNEISAGDNTNITLSNMVPGATYYFAVTARDGSESPFSNEAEYTVPLNPTNPPATLSAPVAANGQFSFSVSGVSGSQYVVEESSDLIHWTPVMTNTVPFVYEPTIGQSSQQFFRAVLLP